MPRGSEPLSENGETTGKDWVSEVTPYTKQHYSIAKKYREVKSHFPEKIPSETVNYFTVERVSILRMTWSFPYCSNQN